MSNIPANLKYSKSHEWILEEDGVFTIGLTDYAQSALGDIVFINLPEEGDRGKRSPQARASAMLNPSRRSPTCSPPSPAR